MSAKRDYYEVLCVIRTANDDEIKKSYRKLAMQYHPDRNPGDKKAEELFKEAAEAYAVLSDPQKRAQYDQFGHSLGSNGFQGFEGFSGFGDVFGDIFEDFFGGGRSSSRGGARRGADLQMTVEVSLQDLLKPHEVKVEVPRHDTCPECEGGGSEKGSSKITCRDCGGKGEVRITQGFFTMRRTCPACQGVGEKIEKKCKNCKGTGRTPKKKTLSVTIPAGMDAQSQLKVTGEGEIGERGGRRGDLYIQIKIHSDSIFERQGENLYCAVLIPYTIAVLGGEIKIPTLEEEIDLKISAGTPSGKIFKMQSHGMPYLNQPSQRGSLFVKVDVEVPTKLSDKAKQILRDYAAERGVKVQPKKKGFFEQFKESF